MATSAEVPASDLVTTPSPASTAPTFDPAGPKSVMVPKTYPKCAHVPLNLLGLCVLSYCHFLLYCIYLRREEMW